jgi:hypothetical protein
MAKPATTISVWLTAAVNFICIVGIIFETGRVYQRLDDFIIESRNDRTEIKKDLKEHINETRGVSSFQFKGDPNIFRN